MRFSHLGGGNRDSLGCPGLPKVTRKLPCTAELNPEVMATWAILSVGVTGPWRSEPKGPREVTQCRGPRRDLKGAQASGEESEWG